jgi:hypothetical protein
MGSEDKVQRIRRHTHSPLNPSKQVKNEKEKAFKHMIAH